MDFTFKSFEELSTEELYQILRLRSEVFVVEQDCVYQDIDNKDQKAFHVLGYNRGSLIAYARIFDAGDYFDKPSIGRIIVKQTERNANYGHQLVAVSIDFIHGNFSEKSILISAQVYLLDFYKSHGFQAIGAQYLEDGIPHIQMLKD